MRLMSLSLQSEWMRERPDLTEAGEGPPTLCGRFVCVSQRVLRVGMWLNFD